MRDRVKEARHRLAIQIEKLKKNLKSGGAELSFLNSDEKLSTEDAWENRCHADSKDDLK